MQHREAWIGRQAHLGADDIEDARDQGRAHESASGHDEDAGVWEAEPLGHEQTAEIGLIAHDDVRLPGAADVFDQRDLPTRGAVGEAVAELFGLAIRVERAQGGAGGCLVTFRA